MSDDGNVETVIKEREASLIPLVSMTRSAHGFCFTVWFEKKAEAVAFSKLDFEARVNARRAA